MQLTDIAHYYDNLWANFSHPNTTFRHQLFPPVGVGRLAQAQAWKVGRHFDPSKPAQASQHRIVNTGAEFY